MADGLLEMVESQAQWHEGTAKALHKRYHGMHLFSSCLVICSFAGVVLHFILPLFLEAESEWLLYLTAFLPALAAALHGIKTKLEMARVSASSHLTANNLTSLAAVIKNDRANTVRQNDPWENTLYLREIAIRAAAVMSDENQQWKALIGEQETEMPV